MESSDGSANYHDEIYSVFYNCMKYIPFVTFPIYAETIYCIIKRRAQLQQHYRTILTAHVLGSLYEEWYGFELFRPMVFTPVVGIYADGILSMIGVHPFVQLYGMFLAVQMNSSILTHITLHRMKTIIPISYRYYSCFIRSGVFFTFFIYVWCALSVNCIFLTVEDQLEAKTFISMTVRPIPNVFWSEKYIVSSPRNRNIFIFLICATVCIGFYVFLCITIPSICFVILHRTRHSLSRTVIKAQRAYLRSLLLQAIIVIACVIIPFSVFLAGMTNAITNPIIIPSYLIFSICNGSASTLIHLLFNKPFRGIMKTQLSWIACLLTCSRPEPKVHHLSSILA